MNTVSMMTNDWWAQCKVYTPENFVGKLLILYKIKGKPSKMKVNKNVCLVTSSTHVCCPKPLKNILVISLLYPCKLDSPVGLCGITLFELALTGTCNYATSKKNEDSMHENFVRLCVKHVLLLCAFIFWTWTI